MDFERDNKNRDWTPEDGGQWTKEEAKRDPRFDFAAFLGPDDLEDRITDALDGKDLMDREAYGEFTPDYMRRRSVPEGHGRHEIPGSDTEEEDEEEETEEQEDQSPEQEDAPPAEAEMDFQEEPQQKPVFVDEPPPRPKVIVAEPAPRVYVDPHAAGYGEVEEEPVRGGGKGVKWLIAALISAAIVLGAVLLVSRFLPDIGGIFGANSASPAPSDVLGGIPEVRPTQPPVPTPTPELAAPEVRIYNVTASTGGGGSVYPSGKVDVQEGGSVDFTFTAEDGYEISKVVVDGVEGSIQTGYAFTDVRQDHTIYVEFRHVELPPTAVVVTDEPTPEPTAEPIAEPTAEPAEPPAETTEEPAPEPIPDDTDSEEPPFVGGEGQPELPPETAE